MKIKIKKRLNQIEEARTYQDVLSDLKGKTSEAFITNLQNSVPSDIGDGKKVEVANWLKKKFRDQLEKSVLSNEDKAAIENYYKVKKYASEKQIAKINSFKQMKEITAEAEPSWAAAEEKKAKKAAGKVDKSKLNIEKLQSSDPNWEIFLPHDQNAAMHLGSICFSHWCTSARSTENMFNDYYKKDDPIFVFRHKTQKEKITVDRGDGQKIEIEVPLMYQIHFGMNQFMNRKDEQVKTDTKMLLLNLIQNSKTEDEKPAEEKYPAINRIQMYKSGKEIVEIFINKSGIKYWRLNGKGRFNRL